MFRGGCELRIFFFFGCVMQHAGFISSAKGWNCVWCSEMQAVNKSTTREVPQDVLLMGGAVFPACWLFGLRHPTIGALQGPGIGADENKMFVSTRVKVADYLKSPHQCPCHRGEPQPYDTSPETVQDQLVDLTQAPMKSLLLPWVLGHTVRRCVSSKNEVYASSTAPVVRWSSCSPSPMGLQSQILGGFFPWCKTLRLRCLMGLRTLVIPTGELWWFNYSPVCRAQGIWDLDCTMNVPLLPSCGSSLYSTVQVIFWQVLFFCWWWFHS